jgi:arginyl-tRNA synthetase
MLHDLVGEIGSDAIRVYMGSAGFDTSVNIDLDVATSQTEDNPVYYIQYAHARICQIIKKAASKGLTPAASLPADYVLAPEERDLLVHIFKFPDQVNEAAGYRNVSTILKYTIELASLFHSFYSKCTVVNDQQAATSAVRLAMVMAVKQMLLNAFSLLGVSAPGEMKRE